MTDWQTKPLSDLCEFQRGLTYAKADEVSISENVVLRANNVDLSSNALDLTDLRFISDSVLVPPDKKLRKDSLLICTASGSKTHLGKVAYIDDDYGYAFGGFMGQITPVTGINGRYLFHALTSPAYKDFIAALSDGANINNLKFSDLRQFLVSVPSLEEQQRIVAILDEAFEGITTAKANADKNLQNARELFASRAQVLLAENAEWERVQLSELMARGWITSHLDGNHGSDYPRKEEFVDSGVPYIAASAIRNGIVDFDHAKYLSPARATSIRKGRAKNRDVLFAHNATVGPVAVLETDQEFVILGTSLTYYRCNDQHIRPEYLAHFMLSPQFTSQYSQVMKQSTRNQVPITMQRSFIHVIPPIAVQHEIADDLDELAAHSERLMSVFERKLSALAELKASLLHQVFSGQL
ncbi:MAG: hypothetical protein EON54_06630 [Alcaligenaceae bacterium]|nr:MAG: hypothetical protein EON54_06630 [Alcaligenaceae bacterium]